MILINQYQKTSILKKLMLFTKKSLISMDWILETGLYTNQWSWQDILVAILLKSNSGREFQKPAEIQSAQQKVFSIKHITLMDWQLARI